MEVKCRKVKFEVDESLHPDSWQYIINEEWENETFDVIDYFVKKKDTVIDIGCWIGSLSLYLAANGAKVYAIEPDPVAYAGFLENIRLNPTLETSIFAFDIAISPKTNPVTLHARQTYGGSSSSILNRTLDKQHACEVKGVSFSDFIEQNKLQQVDFIKMDIEGGEFEVLPSMDEALKQLNFPTMIVEFHYPHLNEFIYLKKFKLKFIARIMMKVERKLGIYIFKYAIIAKIRTVLPTIKLYPFIYNEFGNRIEHEKLTAKFMLVNKSNLVLSTIEWLKSN